MIDDFDREHRKNKKKNNLQHKNKKFEISEEQRFVSKSKKAFKNKIEDIRCDEIWNDWEENENQ